MKFLKVLVTVATAAILDGARNLLEVLGSPGRVEAGTDRRSEREQERPVLRGDGRARHRWVRNRHHAHRRGLELVAVEREPGRSPEHDVQLLLVARRLVVLVNEARAGIAAEGLHAERAESEVVLE